MLSVSDYFNHIPEEFQELFENVEFVWEILGRIPRFFQNRPQENIILGTVSPDAYLEGNQIFIDKNAIVEPGAYIIGPAYIGSGTVVRHGAYLRGNVIAGRNCVLGHTTEIKNSVFLDESKAGHFAYVGDSILGKDVNLGAGTKLANFKVVSTPIQIRWKNQEFSTHLRKLGAILGDNVSLGCNTVTMPGTLMGPDCISYPNTTIRGVVLSGHSVKMDARMSVRKMH